MIKVAYPHPGEILGEEFLAPMDITRYRLAKEIRVPQRRIDEIVSGHRSITADTALRLSRFFGTSDAFWLNLQAGYDARVTKGEMADTLQAIKPVATGSPEAPAARAAKVPSAKPSKARVRTSAHGVARNAAKGAPAKKALQTHVRKRA
jgi:addiction module HigA family antidote